MSGRPGRPGQRQRKPRTTERCRPRRRPETRCHCVCLWALHAQLLPAARPGPPARPASALQQTPHPHTLQRIVGRRPTSVQPPRRPALLEQPRPRPWLLLAQAPPPGPPCPEPQHPPVELWSLPPARPAPPLRQPWRRPLTRKPRRWLHWSSRQPPPPPAPPLLIDLRRLRTCQLLPPPLVLPRALPPLRPLRPTATFPARQQQLRLQAPRLPLPRRGRAPLPRPRAALHRRQRLGRRGFGARTWAARPPPSAGGRSGRPRLREQRLLPGRQCAGPADPVARLLPLPGRAGQR
mmetsp:Transcript_21990/g.83669  ORF Transcript_21990/g.83669 Transcript_21990/m.83669 type:complete len:293 (-) Transcript_21990:1008-1886(-)